MHIKPQMKSKAINITKPLSMQNCCERKLLMAIYLQIIIVYNDSFKSHPDKNRTS